MTEKLRMTWQLPRQMPPQRVAGVRFFVRSYSISAFLLMISDLSEKSELINKTEQLRWLGKIKQKDQNQKQNAEDTSAWF